MKTVYIDAKGAGGKVVLNLDRLIAIERQLGKRYITKVGIMGAASTSRQNLIKKGHVSVNGKLKPAVNGPSTMTNAEIGLIHEKGSKSQGIPRRSFLEVPLETKLPKYLKLIGQKVMDCLTRENIKSAYVNLGIIGENIVQAAFRTGGFGKWPDIKQATKDRKGSSAILIDTKQLRESVASTVVSKAVSS